MTRVLHAKQPPQPWDVEAEVQTVADAVRIGREAAQQMLATAALFAFGTNATTEELAIEIHLFTVETVSELSTAEVPRVIDHTESGSKE